MKFTLKTALLTPSLFFRRFLQGQEFGRRYVENAHLGELLLGYRLVLLRDMTVARTFFVLLVA